MTEAKNISGGGVHELARLDGVKGPKRDEVELASRRIVLAAGLSAVAAILAIAGWVRNIG